MLTAAQKEDLRERIADRLVEMESMFDPRCKLSFVMRSPHLPDGDLIVTNDDPKLLIKAIERLSGYDVIAHPEAASSPNPKGDE